MLPGCVVPDDANNQAHCPVPPGGVADVLARLLAEQIGRAQGPTFVVENRPGAATMIATDAVSRAAPDGNTVLLVGNNFLIAPHLKKTSYDPTTSFEPICHLARSTFIIAVNGRSAYRTLADLLDAARAKPGELTLGGAGPVTSGHIAFEVLKRAAKFDMNFVPYPGDSAAVNALLGDHVTSVFANFSSAAEQSRSGKLRALATTSRARAETLATCRLSPNSVTGTTKRTSGKGSSRRRRRQKRRSPSLHDGSARR